MTGQIRLARPADIPVVAGIVRDAYTPYIARIGKKPGPMLDDYDALVREGRVQVLEEDGAIVAILVLVPEADYMLLDNIAVAPSAHKRGHGRRLIAHAQDEARRAGFAELRLYTHQLMTENVALYQRLGFVETHRVTEKGFDRVYMRKVV
jgi:N-acetylglutamate synthase-like GNAT family acetyltransferase